MMQAYLPEVFEFIKDTGDFEEIPEEYSGDDIKVSDSDTEDRKPIRTHTFSSPPQSRPLTVTATAQSSAALLGALSPPRMDVYSQTLSPSSALHYTMTSPSRSPAPPQPSFGSATLAATSPASQVLRPPKIVGAADPNVDETFADMSTGIPGHAG